MGFSTLRVQKWFPQMPTLSQMAPPGFEKPIEDEKTLKLKCFFF